MGPCRDGRIEAAVTMGKLEIGKQAWHAGVVDGVAVPAGFLRQRAGRATTCRSLALVAGAG